MQSHDEELWDRFAFWPTYGQWLKVGEQGHHVVVTCYRDHHLDERPMFPDREHYVDIEGERSPEWRLSPDPNYLPVLWSGAWFWGSDHHLTWKVGPYTLEIVSTNSPRRNIYRGVENCSNDSNYHVRYILVHDFTEKDLASSA
jgi:hypothetical protein